MIDATIKVLGDWWTERGYPDLDSVYITYSPITLDRELVFVLSSGEERRVTLSREISYRDNRASYLKWLIKAVERIISDEEKEDAVMRAGTIAADKWIAEFEAAQ